MFEEWLEQEQATMASISHPDGNVETLEKTLEQLQVSVLWDLCMVCLLIKVIYKNNNRLPI